MPKKEYGGYIELDYQYGNELYPDAVDLNCGRNCLAYLIESKDIRKIYLPYFLCSSVKETCQKYNVEISYYHIDRYFRPVLSDILDNNAYIYLVNYYSQFTEEEIKFWKDQFEFLIVDNAQAFFQKPLNGIDTIYSCRKFFGVADGAYLYTKAPKIENLEQDISYNRMNFLLGRFEKSANEFYSEYVSNNYYFKGEPIKKMSKLTHNLLRGIDYDKVAFIREKNFALLNDLLGGYNKLCLNIPGGAFMYPLYIDEGEKIRKKLQQEKIYVPVLWPDVYEQEHEAELECDMAKNILPLPVDQRYDEEDMHYIAQEVKKYLS